jgi:hypothetical protein
MTATLSAVPTIYSWTFIHASGTGDPDRAGRRCESPFSAERLRQT